MDAQISLAEGSTLGAVFVDLKDAFNCIDFNILHRKLSILNFPDEVAHRLAYLFHDRKVFVRDGCNRIVGPRIALGGLPQGASLSPILFNLYTLDLHQQFNSNISIIQYADDICI